LVFQDNERIAPWNPSTNSLRDNAIDLGDVDRRFKDLHLAGSLYVGGSTVIDNNRRILAADGAANVPYYTFSGDTNTGLFNPSADNLGFSTGGTERARIDSSGNLLVGTTDSTPNGLSVEGAIVALNDGTRYAISLATSTSAQSTAAAFSNTNGLVGTITTTGSSTAYNTSSDERLKENIQDAEDAGSKIDAIKVRQFDWKADGSHQDYGVIAQELAEVAPEAVTEGETEDDMMAVDYSKLVPTLIKEIQTLRNRVAQLEE
jgi:hypothetical protein